MQPVDGCNLLDVLAIAAWFVMAAACLGIECFIRVRGWRDADHE